MKTVMISIRPEWCDKITSGKKTVEIRKTRPKIAPPFKCYIYCTKAKTVNDNYWIMDRTGFNWIGNSKVVGEFICDRVERYCLVGTSRNNMCYMQAPDDQCPYVREIDIDALCLTTQELEAYGGGRNMYGWHISDLAIYDKPLPLSAFRKKCVMPECPYCPACDVGYEYISETEAEFLRVDGTCSTEWRCLNYLKRPPQSWCYVEVCDEKS